MFPFLVVKTLSTDIIIILKKYQQYRRDKKVWRIWFPLKKPPQSSKRRRHQLPATKKTSIETGRDVQYLSTVVKGSNVTAVAA